VGIYMSSYVYYYLLLLLYYNTLGERVVQTIKRADIEQRHFCGWTSASRLICVTPFSVSIIVINI